jgi:Cu(I)/Ag(I) efflux system membrane fusion protein/cobalt-zinc-cadmium efflux system membrane fusion protein
MSSSKKDALALPAAKRSARWFSAAAFFAVGVLVTLFIVLDPFALRGAAPKGEAAAEVVAEVYRCPMHPEVIDDHASACPICGMPLELVRDSGADAGDGWIEIDPRIVQRSGVISVEATLGPIERGLNTVGTLDFNADEIDWVNTKFSGWIERVHVAYVGQEVKTGQPLFDIYSPELVTTQEEYLRAVDYKRSLEGSQRSETRAQAEALLDSTRQRLRYLGFPEEQISMLDQGQPVERLVTVRSDVDGVVTEVLNESLEGMHVNAGQNLYRIADTSTVWLHADVFESDMPWVREGQRAEVRFPSDKNRVQHGKVLFLYPELAQSTRTLKICIELENQDHQLRAGMYADVRILGAPIEDAVLIPREAVIRTGQREIVFVDLGEGRFEPREIATGIQSDGRQLQVVSGVEVGERVVTQAQFLLDSESRLQDAIARFHGGHS